MTIENLAILSCNGGTITHGSGPAEVLKVATIQGLYTLRRRGPSDWANEGAVLEDVHVSAVLWAARSGLLFAGGHLDGGLWVSSDQGES